MSLDRDRFVYGTGKYFGLKAKKGGGGWKKVSEEELRALEADVESGPVSGITPAAPDNGATKKKGPFGWPWSNWAAVLAAVVILPFALLAGGDSDAEGPDPRNQAPWIGDTARNDDGVAIFLSEIDYSPDLPDSFLLGEPLGKFVGVAFRVRNNSDETVTVYSRFLTAEVGTRTYEVESLFTPDGDWEASQDINPGLVADYVAFIDLPEGQSIDTVRFDRLGFGESIVFESG